MLAQGAEVRVTAAMPSATADVLPLQLPPRDLLGGIRCSTPPPPLPAVPAATLPLAHTLVAAASAAPPPEVVLRSSSDGAAPGSGSGASAQSSAAGGEGDLTREVVHGGELLADFPDNDSSTSGGSVAAETAVGSGVDTAVGSAVDMAVGSAFTTIGCTDGGGGGGRGGESIGSLRSEIGDLRFELEALRGMLSDGLQQRDEAKKSRVAATVRCEDLQRGKAAALAQLREANAEAQYLRSQLALSERRENEMEALQRLQQQITTQLTQQWQPPPPQQLTLPLPGGGGGAPPRPASAPPGAEEDGSSAPPLLQEANTADALPPVLLGSGQESEPFQRSGPPTAASVGLGFPIVLASGPPTSAPTVAPSPLDSGSGRSTPGLPRPGAGVRRGGRPPLGAPPCPAECLAPPCPAECLGAKPAESKPTEAAGEVQGSGPDIESGSAFANGGGLAEPTPVDDSGGPAGSRPSAHGLLPHGLQHHGMSRSSSYRGIEKSRSTQDLAPFSHERTDSIDEMWCVVLQRFPQYPHWALVKEKTGVYRMGGPNGKKILCRVSHGGLQVRVGGGWQGAAGFLEKHGPMYMGTRPSEANFRKNCGLAVLSGPAIFESDHLCSILDTPASMERLLVPTKCWAQKIGINKTPDVREQRRLVPRDNSCPTVRRGSSHSPSRGSGGRPASPASPGPSSPSAMLAASLPAHVAAAARRFEREVAASQALQPLGHPGAALPTPLLPMPGEARAHAPASPSRPLAARCQGPAGVELPKSPKSSHQAKQRQGDARH